MYVKAKNDQVQKYHNAKHGRGGYTLVELCVVLALLAILTTMIVSFSVLMNGFAAENKAQYEFLEDHAALRRRLCAWAAENDVEGCVFTANDDGTLTVAANGTEKAVSFSDGILTLGEDQRSGLDAIEGVTFTSNGKLVKCTAYRKEKNGVRMESSFVFSLRCGVTEEAADEE